MSDFFDLWSEASRDFEEEQALRRLHSAKARVAGTWSFLANAQDTGEYAQRKEMAVQALADAVWAVTADADEAEDTWKRLHASLDEDFGVIVEARKLAHKTASHEPRSYVYEADIHCPSCTEKRFGRDEDGWIAGGSKDNEGNEVGAVAPWDEHDSHGEHCGTCGTQTDKPYDHSPDSCGYEGCTGEVVNGQVMYHRPDRTNAHQNDEPDGQGTLPFESARKAGSRVAANDAEQAQYSAEVAGNRAAEAATPHMQHCNDCGAHFNGNAGRINFTPGPGGVEWNHCPECGAGAQHGHVQDCDSTCQHDHDDHDYRDYDAIDYDADDQDPHYGDVHYREGSKTAASETNQDECGICGTRLTGHKPAEQNENGSWGMDEHYDENGEAATGGPGNRNGGHWHRPANIRPPVTDPQVHTFNSTGEAYDTSQTDEGIKDGDVLSVPNEGVHGYLHHAWPVAVVHPDNPGAFHTFEGGEGYHEDKGRYETSKAKAQEVAGGHTASRKVTLNVLAVVRILAGEDAGKFIIVDESSGYKIAGPFGSRSEAEAAIASGKFDGKSVKIEQVGQEEAKEEDAHRGGKGSHDDSGGTKPFDDKGHHRKRESSLPKG